MRSCDFFESRVLAEIAKVPWPKSMSAISSLTRTLKGPTPENIAAASRFGLLGGRRIFSAYGSKSSLRLLRPAGTPASTNRRVCGYGRKRGAPSVLLTHFANAVAVQRRRKPFTDPFASKSTVSLLGGVMVMVKGPDSVPPELTVYSPLIEATAVLTTSFPVGET